MTDVSPGREPHAPEIGRHLLLRDRLRDDPADREPYTGVKRRLAARDWPTMQHYAEAKCAVIEENVERARETRRSR